MVTTDGIRAHCRAQHALSLNTGTTRPSAKRGNAKHPTHEERLPKSLSALPEIVEPPRHPTIARDFELYVFCFYQERTTFATFRPCTLKPNATCAGICRSLAPAYICIPFVETLLRKTAMTMILCSRMMPTRPGKPTVAVIQATGTVARPSPRHGEAMGAVRFCHGWPSSGTAAKLSEVSDDEPTAQRRQELPPDLDRRYFAAQPASGAPPYL